MSIMSNLLGSAEWSTDTGHRRYDAIGQDGGPLQGRFLLLGESREVLGNLHVRAPRQHVLTIAQTRSGKGVSLIIPNLLNYLGAALVVDPKGENAWLTAPFRQQVLGPENRTSSIPGARSIAAMDRWPRRGSNQSIASFNPLSILKPGSDDFIEDLAYLADALIITQSTKDPYWDDTARELWAGLMAFVVEHPAYSDRASLGLARQLLMQSNDALQRTIRTAIGLGPESVAAKKLAQFELPKDKESTSIAGVISAARTQTAFLDSPILTRSMDSSDFSFEELCAGNASVYLVLPVDKLETYARWLRLMVSAGIRAVARGAGKGQRGREDRSRRMQRRTPRRRRASRAFHAGRVRNHREAGRGRAGLRADGGAGDDHVGLRAGYQSTGARLSAPLGNLHRQFAGGDVLRRHGQFYGGVYQQNAGHRDDPADKRVDLRQQIESAPRTRPRAVHSENVHLDFDQHVGANDEQAALKSRRDPGPRR